MATLRDLVKKESNHEGSDKVNTEELADSIIKSSQRSEESLRDIIVPLNDSFKNQIPGRVIADISSLWPESKRKSKEV